MERRKTPVENICGKCEPLFYFSNHNKGNRKTTPVNGEFKNHGDNKL